MRKLNRFISVVNKNIVRVSYSYNEIEPENSMYISEDFVMESSDILCKDNETLYTVNEDNTISFFVNDRIVLKESSIKYSTKEVQTYKIDGEPIMGTKLTANGEVSYIKNAKTEFERFSNKGSLKFEIGQKDILMGLGQYEDGVFNYHGKKEYLYQSNMRIAIPFIVTTSGYGIFLDTESNVIFNSTDDTIELKIDTTKNIVYYIILGEDVDSLVRTFQKLTGKASMMPRWVAGYVQSKERYKNEAELIETVEEFRKRNIPIDCIVQDWYSWEDGLWGEKIFDKKRYPDLPGCVDRLHEMNTKFMVSIWPNMSPQGENYKEFKKHGGLLNNSNVYNAFEDEFRNLYWRQCEREIMSAGTDALWCDNAEPFSDADWNGEEKRPEELRYELVVGDSKKSMKWEQLNAYGIYHAKGIYENWRKTITDKRVVNLTRSGYVSGQKYGAILWSGDICARWDVIKKQIVEGMKMGLSGNPYWTLDIGGFFTVKDKYENRGCNNESTSPLWFWNGDYNDGVNDPGYREFYTRMLQFGAFLPVFRSHGTDTPREPWNFINQDGVELPFYETIIKYIKLRYSIMPYIYSMYHMAHDESYIMMRSFAFDYSHDEKAIETTDEYMFGPAFLVAPVYEPMYYASNGVKLSKDDGAYNKKVYLPSGAGFYDYYSGKYYEGGQEINAYAGIDTMPLFVKAGSIIPLSEDITYSGEKDGQTDTILIYEGADSIFSLYNDSGDGYDYEKGEYSLIELRYSDKEKCLYLSENKGKMPVNSNFIIKYNHCDGNVFQKEIHYTGEESIKIELQ